MLELYEQNPLIWNSGHQNRRHSLYKSYFTRQRRQNQAEGGRRGEGIFCQKSSYQHKTSIIASIYSLLTVNQACAKCCRYVSVNYSNCSPKQELISPFYKGKECRSKMLSKLLSHKICIQTKILTQVFLDPKPLILTINTLLSPEV